MIPVERNDGNPCKPRISALFIDNKHEPLCIPGLAIYPRRNIHFCCVVSIPLVEPCERRSVMTEFLNADIWQRNPSKAFNPICQRRAGMRSPEENYAARHFLNRPPFI